MPANDHLMPKIFRSNYLQSQFEQNGFVTIDLLDDEGLGQLRNLYTKVELAHKNAAGKFKSTTTTGNKELILSVSEKISSIMHHALNSHFIDYSLLGGSFIIKEPGENSTVAAHQDWTYVDESKFISFNLWLAVDNVSEENGCLWFIPYSHRIIPTLRPSPNYPWPFKDIEQEITKWKKAVPLKAGSCVCFNNGIIHGSYPNLSGQNRLSVVTTLYNKAAQLLHYFVRDAENLNSLEKYELDNLAFMQIKQGSPPPTKALPTTVPYSFLRVNKWQFYSRMLSLYLFSGFKN